MGAVPASRSLDCVSIFARSVEDGAAVASIMQASWPAAGTVSLVCGVTFHFARLKQSGEHAEGVEHPIPLVASTWQCCRRLVASWQTPAGASGQPTSCRLGLGWMTLLL